jgi:holo-[acyl-carrier protein] synthase
MIVATGIDLVDLERIAALLQREGDRFLTRVFTPQEQAYCRSRGQPQEAFGSRFAAKEAVMKCLGTGWSQGVTFVQIEVVRAASGEVGVRLSGRAAEVAAARGIQRIHLSLSHAGSQAVAVAVAEA